MTSVLEERANFTRLCRLLVDKGTKALRIALDGRHPPANLPHVLNANTAKLKQLKHRGIIDDSQMDLLFPPSGDSPDSKTFDITLINILLRNFCGLPCPATGWNTMPPDTDNSFEANITRIKLMRNKFYAHVPSTQVDKTTFEDLWQKISLALTNLKIPQEQIDELKHGFLGPEEKNYVQIITQWISKDDNMLGDLTRDVKDLQQSLQRLEGGIDGLVDRRVYESSYSLLSNINETHLLINSKDLTYDGKRVRWTRTFERLQNFVADVLEERGKWSPKVSCSRKFTSSISDLGLTWYYTKQKTLLFQGQSGKKLKEFLIKLCEISTSIESTRSEGRQNNIEIVSVIEDAASASTIDGVSCKCPCATSILTELEKMKLNMESLESKIDALQSLANAQKVSFTPNDYSSEVHRLKQELFEERHKTSQLESDLASLKKKTLPHKQFSLMHSVNGSANKGSGNLCIGGINLPLIDVPEETCFPNQSISTTVINNVSHTLEMTSSQNQSISIITNNDSIPELRSGTMPIVNRQIMDKENSMLGISPYSKQSSTIPTLSEQLIHKTHHANKKSTQRCSSRINFNRLPLIEISLAKTVNRFVKVNKYSKCGKNLFPR